MTTCGARNNAGGLGSLGVWQRPAEQLRRDVEELRAATGRPFALNHVVPDLDPVAFELTLELAPAVVSFALDDAGELMGRAHDAGSLVMQQVTTVRQGEVAAGHGADIIVAQGAEAGGYGGRVATFALVPQVVDAVRPVPVVAAGGIADGRGLAAALVLGAAGVNVGTRFLASEESPVGDVWKQAILASSSEAWEQLDFFNDIRPNPGALGYGTRLRVAHGVHRPVAATPRRARVDDPALGEIAALQPNRLEGSRRRSQSAGLVRELLPAADIVRMLAAGAEKALAPRPDRPDRLRECRVPPHPSPGARGTTRVPLTLRARPGVGGRPRRAGRDPRRCARASAT
jgi:nitronate monooxygenase/enoyl-[acyl-carrier protein] reductase II